MAFEVHRMVKIGTVFIDEESEEMKQFHVCKDFGLDVFGNLPTKQPDYSGLPKCMCPVCHTSVAPLRFAPHLEKCMGLGRTSSRVASRRIADSGKHVENTPADCDDGDDAADKDWIFARKPVGKKKEKKCRTVKLGKSRNRDLLRKATSSAYQNSTSNRDYQSDVTDEMASEQLQYSGEGTYSPPCPALEGLNKRSASSKRCGAISGITGKRCTRSVRCPQHSNQKKGETAIDHSTAGMLMKEELVVALEESDMISTESTITVNDVDAAAATAAVAAIPPHEELCPVVENISEATWAIVQNTPKGNFMAHTNRPKPKHRKHSRHGKRRSRPAAQSTLQSALPLQMLQAQLPPPTILIEQTIMEETEEHDLSTIPTTLEIPND